MQLYKQVETEQLLPPSKAWNAVRTPPWPESRAGRGSGLWHRLTWKGKHVSHLRVLWMVQKGYREKLLQFTALANRGAFSRVIHSEREEAAYRSSTPVHAPLQLANLHIVHALSSQHKWGRHTETGVGNGAFKKDTQMISISKTMMKEDSLLTLFMRSFDNHRLHTNVWAISRAFYNSWINYPG